MKSQMTFLSLLYACIVLFLQVTIKSVVLESGKMMPASQFGKADSSSGAALTLSAEENTVKESLKVLLVLCV